MTSLGAPINCVFLKYLIAIGYKNTILFTQVSLLTLGKIKTSFSERFFYLTNQIKNVKR